MAKAIGRFITKKLLINGLIDEEDKELYEYATVILCYLATPFILVALMAPITGMLYEGVIMVIPFTLLRRYCGGFHFKSNKLCLVVSFLYLFTMEKIGQRLTVNVYFVVITFICLVALWNIGILKSLQYNPILPQKRNLSLHVICSVLLFCVLMAPMYGPSTFLKWICIGIIMTLILQIPVLVKRPKIFHLRFEDND